MKSYKLLSMLLAVVFVLPAFDVALAQTDDDPVPAYTAPVELDDSPVELPNITRKRLRNGLTIYYVPQHEVPVVTIRLLIRAGSLYNPIDQPGLTYFMGNLLTKGTETRSAMEISETMDFVGGSISSGAGYNGSYVQSTILTRDFEMALELVADIAMHPSFPEEEIERDRRRFLTNMMARLDDAYDIAEDQLPSYLYGEHPYGFPLAGTPASVEAFTRDAIVAQYERLFVPSNAVLAISGDIPWRDAHQLVRQYFSDWDRGDRPDTDYENPEHLEGGQILLIDKPDAAQAEVRMGYVLSPYNMGEDLYAFRVMNQMFGTGGFGCRLMLRVRSELGLTYGIYGNLTARQMEGAYTVEAATSNETAGQLIGETIQLMRDAIADGFTEEELQHAKAYMMGTYPMQYETPEDLATQFQTLLMFNFDDPAEFIETYRARINAVTLEDVNEIARRMLQPDNFRYVVVGQAEILQPQLEEFGEIEVMTIEDLQ